MAAIPLYFLLNLFWMGSTLRAGSESTGKQELEGKSLEQVESCYDSTGFFSKFEQ